MTVNHALPISSPIVVEDAGCGEEVQGRRSVGSLT